MTGGSWIALQPTSLPMKVIRSGSGSRETLNLMKRTRLSGWAKKLLDRIVPLTAN
jgi:hypothetical protein